MNITHQYGILLTKSGEVQNPIILDSFIVAKLLCSFVGIPLNVLITIAIIRQRDLRNKPRNTFLLGIMLSNLLTSLPVIIELAYWTVPTETVCQAYSAVVGLPYSVLLLNMLLALTDKYIAIKFPIWHRKNVTVRLVICVLLLSSALVTFILKFVYIVGLVPIRCEILFVQIKVFGLTTAILFVSCVIANFIVYRQTRTLLQQTRALSGSDEPRNNQEPIIENNGMEEHVELSKFQIQNVNPSSNMAIHVNSENLRKLETEATRTLLAGVTSLFVFTCPPIIFWFSVFICRLINNDVECSSVTWLTPYFRIMGLFHTVYIPLIWLVRDEELQLALKW